MTPRHEDVPATVTTEVMVDRLTVVELKLDRIKASTDNLLSELVRVHGDLLEIRLSLQRLKDVSTDRPPEWNRGET